MKTFLDHLHARLGDFWWYSLMIFFACRSGDVIQAFIGLWLVPKYVGPKELGAVLPLQQLSGLFAVPLAILAIVFAKYVNTYATRGEFGKVKSFIRDVIVISCCVFLVCIGIAHLVIPHFYKRLNVSAGLLTVLILAAGFSGNLANLFTAALQGLKKFKTMTIQNLISAPIRLVTLLVAMPFRALSGYVLGQSTPPATCSLLAAYSLHKDLKAIPTDKTWRKDIPEIMRYLWPLAVYTALSTVFATIHATVYRQRLPEIESSAHYLLTRFTEITGFVGLSMMTILFPLASEAHERGRENRALITKTLLATLGISCVFAIGFAIGAPYVLSLNGTWSVYLPYANLMPRLALVTGLSSAVGVLASYEMACRRFGTPALALAITIVATTLIVCLTGCEFFRGMLPDYYVDFVKSLNVARLSVLIWINLAALMLQLLTMTWVIYRRPRDNQATT